MRLLRTALLLTLALAGCKQQPSAMQLCEALRQAGAAKECRLPAPVPPELAAVSREAATFTLTDAEGEGRVLLLKPGQSARQVAAGLSWLGEPSRACFGTDAGRLLIWLPPRASARDAEAASTLVRGRASSEESAASLCGPG